MSEALLVELSVRELIARVDSKEPAPGGGSVSALIGGLGCALARMYGHLSVEKKKYLAHAEEIKEQFQRAFVCLAGIEEQLMVLVDEDTAIFSRFMEALKLPKTDEQQSLVRRKAMEYTTKEAIESPIRMMELCYEGIKQLEHLIGIGNASAMSDLGVAIACFEAAGKGAYLNVIINLNGLGDDELAYVYEKRARLKLDQIMYCSFEMFGRVKMEIIK